MNAWRIWTQSFGTTAGGEGSGTCPSWGCRVWIWAREIFPSGNPPLSMLTDLAKLRHLKLRNGDDVDDWSDPDFWSVNIEEFFGATQLRSLAVTKFTEIHKLLQNPSLGKILVDIEVMRPWYRRKQGTKHWGLWRWLYDQRFSWKRICLGADKRDRCDLDNRLYEERQITELRVPVEDKCLVRIKSTILPALSNLEVLHITG